MIGIYGHLEHKNLEVFSAKAHIPLFAARNTLEELFMSCFSRLQDLGCFVNFGTTLQGGKNMFQFSINDPELLKLFVQWHKTKKADSHFSLEHFEQKQNAIKDQLLDFITSSPELSIPGKEEVLELIKSHPTKFLKVG